MDIINEIVSLNIRHIRQEKNVSLDELAKLSGVSKSMLAQIERGIANPSLSTLWKIANGLMISFNELVTRPNASQEVVRISDLEPIESENIGLKNFVIFSGDEKQRFSVYYIEIQPGFGWTSEMHLRGTVEFITVFKGNLEFTVNKNVFNLNEGDSIRFIADTSHSYKNTGDVPLVFHNILYNP